MRRKDMAAALHSVANEVHHGNLPEADFRGKLARLADAGIEAPAMEQVIGETGPVEAPAEPADD